VQLLVCWLIVPLIAVALSAGLGLLVEAAGGRPLPAVLLLPVGLAGLFALTQVTTTWGWLAPATLPIVVVAAVAGLVLGRRHLRALRPDPWPIAAAVGVFVVFGAPVVFSGDATFAGYTVLGDTSIHLIGADALLEHGRDFAAVPSSSYGAALQGYYAGSGYPSGGPVVVGTLSRLGGQDPAWTFQPVLALLAAMLTLSLYALAGSVVASRRWRAAVAFVAAQPSLVLSYALQGSIKEVGTAWAVTTVAALVPVWVADREGGPRSVVALAVAVSAAVAIVGPAAGVWLAPLAVAAVVAAAYVRGRRGWPSLAGAAAVCAVVVVALCWQALSSLGTYVDVAGGVVTSQAESGNLLAPLRAAQMFGVWLAGDYRQLPVATLDDTYALVGVVALAAVFGLLMLVRRRALGVGLYVAVSLLAWSYVTRNGSPWADGKALMIVSPAVLLVAMLGAYALAARGRRVEGVLVAAVIAGGVLWSNGLAYHDVSLAPHDRLAELESIGDRLAGTGPTLYPEFEEFGKHFLRDSVPEGPSEVWRSRPVLASSSPAGGPRFAVSTDLDQLAHEYVGQFHSIVLRRGYGTSRPPSDFRRVSSGRWYELWQRVPGAKVLAHVPLGVPLAPAAVPSCGEVRGLAAQARAQDARLVAAPRAAAPTMAPGKADHSPSWVVHPDGVSLSPIGPGEVNGRITVPAAGAWEVWLTGSFGRGVTVSVDGRRVGGVHYRLNGRDDAELAGTVRLAAGRHEVRLARGGGSLHPGNGSDPRFGPVALAPAGGPPPLRTVAPADAASLCGTSLDWIEIVGGAA
jgi:hypothetical protein